VYILSLHKEKAMPVTKKSTTSSPETSKAEAPEKKMPDAQEFRDYIRSLAIGAVRVVIEEVMLCELEQCVGAKWGEITPERKGYRNGYYTRDLITSTGRIEDLSVPRDREGQFQTQVFEQYGRFEPDVADALTEMFVSGTSTHKIGNVAEKLMGVAPSASTISRLNHTLTEQYEAWLLLPLQTHYRILYLDGIYFGVRHGDQVDSTVILTALSVDFEGKKEVLTLRACAEESKDGWMCLLQDMRTRGAVQFDIIVTDGHEGIITALKALFPNTPRQRCTVHKQRNVMNAIPKREREGISTELSGIWHQETKEKALVQFDLFKAKYSQRYPEAVRSLCEDEEHLFTFYAFPRVMHRYIHSTNAIESFFSNVRDRTDQIDTFTTETSCVTIVWAVMQNIRLQKIPGSSSKGMDS
jgi:putative transposase